MGLPFNLLLSADTKFIPVGKIPALTAKAIYPESENDLAREGCQINHEEALRKAIKAGMVTPLNPLSYERHTFPFGDALQRAVISLADFKRFAETLQIEVVIWDEPVPTQDDMAGTKTHLTIREAASALAEKYGFNENTTNTMREQLSAAAERGDVTVRHPHTLLPYTPNPRRDFYELVSLSDLNAWLKTQGAEYQLDITEQAQQELSDEDQANASNHTKGLINRNDVMACFPVKPDGDENFKFWNGRLSRPPKELLPARKFPGKPGTSALWDPLLIAHYLLGSGKVKCHMTRKRLNVVMSSHFPELLDLWEGQMQDAR